MNTLQKNELLKRTARASILSQDAVHYVLINGNQGKWTENADLAEIYIRQGFKLYAKMRNGELIL